MRRLLPLIVLVCGASCGNAILDTVGEIQGEACDAAGRAVVGAKILVDGAIHVTDIDGHFRALHVRPGRISVVVNEAKRVDVVVPENDIAVVFDASCRATHDAPPFAAYGRAPRT